MLFFFNCAQMQEKNPTFPWVRREKKMIRDNKMFDRMMKKSVFVFRITILFMNNVTVNFYQNSLDKRIINALCLFRINSYLVQQ